MTLTSSQLISPIRLNCSIWRSRLLPRAIMVYSQTGPGPTELGALPLGLTGVLGGGLGGAFVVSLPFSLLCAMSCPVIRPPVVAARVAVRGSRVAPPVDTCARG